MKARRGWGWPLVPVYAAGLGVKDRLRAFLGPQALGLLRVKRLGWPVVSVGSLSAGGAGKTPVVIALAELLQRRGWRVDVLSRGYGRAGVGVERVNLGAEDAARRFGDEPVLVTRRTGVPVWVGGERFAAGVAAEKFTAGGGEADSSAALRNDKNRRVHLLDDGFQHRRLARAVDVVLVTESDLEDALLPAGDRRERLAALRRADVVVLREEERERVEARVRRWMRDGAVVWSVRRELRVPDEVLAGRRVVGFCGIARPEGFWVMLAQAGCEVVEKVAFGDHHAYGAGDVERLVKLARDCGAAGFVTTEKDAVKLAGSLGGEMRAELETVGVVGVARLDAKFVDEVGVARELEGRIG